MKALELTFRRGHLKRHRDLLDRLAALAPVKKVTLDAARDRALLLYASEREGDLLAAIGVLELPLVGLSTGEPRSADRPAGAGEG